jgi:hypothetical protein
MGTRPSLKKPTILKGHFGLLFIDVAAAVEWGRKPTFETSVKSADYSHGEYF